MEYSFIILKWLFGVLITRAWDLMHGKWLKHACKYAIKIVEISMNNVKIYF